MKSIIFTILILLGSLFNSYAQSFTISPASADTNKTIDIIVTGNFENSSYFIGFTYRGSFVDITVNSVVKESNKKLLANITVGKNVFTREYDVLLIKNNDTIDYDQDGFHINGLPRPIIKSISPDFGHRQDTIELTIIGENTHFLQAGYNYIRFDNGHLFDSLSITEKRIINDTLIFAKFIVPGDAGTWGHNFYLRNKIDDWIWLENGFNIISPWIASVKTEDFYAGETNEIIITGRSTHFSTAENNIIDIYSISDYNVVRTENLIVIDDTLIKAQITIPLKTKSGYYFISVTNSIDKEMRAYNNIRVLPPYISSITNEELKSGDTSTIYFYTKKTHFLQATNFEFSISSNIFELKIDPNNCIAINDTVLKLDLWIPVDTYEDYYNVSIENDIDERMDLPYPLYITGIPKPYIKEVVITQKTIYLNDTVDITIKGLNTHFLSCTYLKILFSLDTWDTSQYNHFESLTINNDSIINLSFIIPDEGYYIPYYDLIIADSLDGMMFFQNALIISTRIGVKNTSFQNGISVYPNPLSSILTVEFHVLQTSELRIDLYDISGKSIARLTEQEFNTGLNVVNYDFSKLKPGMYYIGFTDKKHNLKGFKRIIKEY